MDPDLNQDLYQDPEHINKRVLPPRICSQPGQRPALKPELDSEAQKDLGAEGGRLPFPNRPDFEPGQKSQFMSRSFYKPGTGQEPVWRRSDSSLERSDPEGGPRPLKADVMRCHSIDRGIHFRGHPILEKNIWLDLQKYVRESVKIDSGPPARYQLKPKRVNLDKQSDEESKLRRFTVEEPDYSYQNRTLLLVGATGSGKSTMINVFVNFVMGVKFEDKIWFEIVGDEKSRSLLDSQTSAVSVYEIYGFEGKIVPYSLTIIDTPGFGDTKGIEYDDIIPKKLQDLFCIPDGVDTINAVGLVMKASDNRLDERMAYILNSVTSLFGKEMENNIVVMMTHFEGRKPKDPLRFLDDSKVNCARENGNAIYFAFKNCQKEKIEDDSDDETEAQNAFITSYKGMTKFTEFFGKTKAVSMKSTLEVMRERVRLTACMHNVRERIATIEKKQKTIMRNRAELERQGKLFTTDKDTCIEVEVTHREKQHISSWWDNEAVTCNICKENCHYPGCTWAWSPQLCEVMKDGKCTSCTGKCDVSFHVRKKWKYVDITRKVKMPVKHLMDLEKEMSDLQQKKDLGLDRAFWHIEQLEKIALNVDSVSTFVHLDFLIEKMKERGATEKIHKLEAMRGRINEKNQAAGKYFWRNRLHLQSLCSSPPTS